MVLLMVITLFPIPILFIESWIAEVNGCTGYKRSGYPCLINGADWSGTLHMMRMSVWLLNATFPLFVLGAVIWAFVLLIARVLWNRSKNNVV